MPNKKDIEVIQFFRDGAFITLLNEELTNQNRLFAEVPHSC